MHEQHKSMEKFNDICEMKHQILRFVAGEIAIFEKCQYRIGGGT